MTTFDVSAEVQFRHVPVKHDPFEDTHKPKCPTYKIDDADLEKALAHGHSIKDKIRSLEHELDLTRNVVNTTRISSTARHVIPSISKEQVRLLHHEQRAFEEASKVLAKNLKLDNIRDLSHIQVQHILPHQRSKRQSCKPPIFCNRSRFRTADGSCNNLRNPRWGKSFECIIRLLDPAYADGVSKPRVAKSGNRLPNARVLSGTIHQQEDVNGNFTHMLMQCSEPSRKLICFRAGDNSRVNQHPGLTALHIVWLRHHNRIASLLQELNPHWNDERLFQEARRIIGAQLQHITYAEFLPVVLGHNAMNFYKLNVQKSGFSNYDPSVNPSIISEFSSAAYRFGHTIVNGRFTMISSDSKRSAFMLKDNFFSPFRLRDGQLDQIMRGLVGRSAQRFDPFCHADLRNNLYKSKSETTGSDLPAMNIQRGRDHGIPGYVHYVKLCFDD
ncbi:PREDICTED: peroxidasin-like, partial [Rhagoletis zephyria]|uniref:peroxidasin-like n=1 Tax=Rhagoletis zephyria TaxID=28612 RepID=UPI0008116B0B